MDEARPTEATDLAKSSTLQIVPKPPNDLAAEDQQRVRQESEDMLVKIQASLNNRSSVLSLDDLGSDEVVDVGKSVELIETRVNNIVRLENDHESIPDKILQMRRSVDELNPKRTQQHPVTRLIAALPGGKTVVDWWWKSGLRQMAMKRETIRSQIKGIRDGLLGNKQQLLEDNQQLAHLYDFVRGGALLRLQQKAFLLELLAGKLQQLYSGLAPDDPLRDRVRMALEKVIHRAKTLRLNETALTQALATIDITIDGNGKIAESLEEAAVLVPTYLTPLMALYQSMFHQQQGIKTLKNTQEGVGQVIVRTSELTKDSATAVSDAYYDLNGLVAQVEQAQKNLIEAFEEIEYRSRNGMVQAQAEINRLQASSQELRNRQQKLQSGRDLAALPK